MAVSGGNGEKVQLVGERELRFGANGLIPAVVQDATSGEVLMVAYMNQESLQKTVATGETWFYSRSRDSLWHKGEESGHVQHVREILADCDHDVLLVRVEQEGPGACHEGYASCFHYPLEGAPREGDVPQPTFDPDAVYGSKSDDSSGGHPHHSPGASSTPENLVHDLFGLIASRKENPVEGSYTSYLFAEGIDKILKKVGEETAEVLIAGKGADKEGLVYESADLLYHLLVLMVEAGLAPDDVWNELAKRRGGGGSADAAPGK